MAIFIRHTGCDRCGSSDALAHYSDGSSYCFSCGVPSGATTPGFVRRIEEDDEQVVPPHDLSLDFPLWVFQWIDPTNLKIEELIKNGYFFSQSTGQLVRLFYQDNGEGLPVAARRRASAFETRRNNQTARVPKSQFFGSKAETTGIVQAHRNLQQQAQDEVGSRQETDSCIIVEDSLSAIKCGRHFDSFPLFGSTISRNKLARIVKPYKRVYVWLDSDKLNNARQIADQVKMLGKESQVIYTELDPKYLNVKDYV